MLQRMSNVELIEWGIYSKMEPFGPWRDDIRAGASTAEIVNTLRLGYQGKVIKEVVKPSDYILDFSAPPKPPSSEPQSMEEQKNILQALAKALSK